MLSFIISTVALQMIIYPPSPQGEGMKNAAATRSDLGIAPCVKGRGLGRAGRDALIAPSVALRKSLQKNFKKIEGKEFSRRIR